MRNLLQILISLLVVCGYAQQPPQDILKIAKKSELFEQYTGSIYAQNTPTESNIIDEHSGTYTAKLRYNAYTDALEYKTGPTVYEIAKNTTVHARIGDDYYYYCKFKNQRGFKRNGYYVLVELSDQYRIYKKIELKITQPKENDVVSGSSTVGKVKTTETFFMEINGTLTPLPTNKKEILTVFSDQEEELKKYLKQEKIRLKRQDDLVKFVAKYNALKSLSTSPSRSLLSNTDQNN